MLGVRQRHVLRHSLHCAVCPESHEHLEIQVVVNCVIVELLLLYLVSLVLESEVDPLHEVEDFDGVTEEVVVNLGLVLYNIQRQNILQLHYKLVKQFLGEDAHKLDSRWVLFQIGLIELLLRQ